MKQEPNVQNERESFNKNLFLKWLVQISLSKKFFVITILIIITLLFSLGSFWFGMKVMSSIRSYVGGEGLWSKSQKEATNNLLTYARSFDESDYNNFSAFLQVPLGDKKARLELEKENPDLNIARLGFIQGGNNPDDVNDLIFLYRKFRHVSYMDKAIQIWTAGDARIAELMSIGENIHRVVGSRSGNASDRATTMSQISSLLKQAYDKDQELTILENNFSATLGDASRNIRNILLWVIAILIGILGTLTLLTAYFIAKIIIQVDKSKSRFVSLASHQLRTPPTSMKWFLDMLRSSEIGSLNPKQQEYFNEIYKNNQRMITLINMLLNASKIELGGLIMTPELTNVSNLVPAILQEYNLQIENRKLAVTVSNQKELPPIMTDPKLLYVVLQNIILNAIKYTPIGGKINIETSLKHESENVGDKLIKQDSIVIQVADNGYGIPENDHNKIFSKLFRASNVSKKDTDGTGLGLYISKSIVDNMNGDLWFTSDVNTGTTFYVAISIKA